MFERLITENPLLLRDSKDRVKLSPNSRRGDMHKKVPLDRLQFLQTIGYESSPYCIRARRTLQRATSYDWGALNVVKRAGVYSIMKLKVLIVSTERFGRKESVSKRKKRRTQT